MKALYDVAAPAKLNLFLHVNGRRSDGYHLIQSVFMLIDWHDTLLSQLDWQQRVSACTDAGASIEEVWNDDARESLRSALVGTGARGMLQAAPQAANPLPAFARQAAMAHVVYAPEVRHLEREFLDAYIV